MAVNDTTLVNGVTKIETLTGFRYLFPIATITVNTSANLVTIQELTQDSETRTTAFEEIVNPQGATNAEEYADALANGGFYFNAVPGIPTIENATTDETDTTKILRPDGSGGVEWLADQKDFIDFTTGIPNAAYKEGRVFYDSTKKALSYYNDESDTTINIGQEVVIKVFNNTGSAINNGQVVRVSGAAGSLPSVALSLADTIENAKIAGIATHTIPDNDTGYITRIGQLSGINTTMFSAGDVLYLSDSVPGEITTTQPKIVSAVGLVLDSQVSGNIYIAPATDPEDPFAVGQNFNSVGGHVQAVTTTPTPMEGFTNTPFTQNVVITSTPSNGSFRCIISPETAAFSGFYEITGQSTVASSDNTVLVVELYINGSPSGLIGKVDFTNNNTDEGTINLTAITQTIIDDTDNLELYVYCQSGTTNITYDTQLFNVKRLGTV